MSEPLLYGDCIDLWEAYRDIDAAFDLLAAGKLAGIQPVMGSHDWVASFTASWP